MRVKRKRGECNPFFLAAEGGSTHPRILGAIWRSAAEPREAWGVVFKLKYSMNFFLNLLTGNLKKQKKTAE